MDWPLFTGAVEEAVALLPAMPDNPTNAEITSRYQDMCKIMNQAGHLHVGKVRPARQTRQWMTREIRNLIKERNRLRRDVGQNRERWLNICHEIRKKSREAREQCWREFLESCSFSPALDGRGEERGDRYVASATDAWRVVRGLSGTPSSTSPNEALVHRGRSITSNIRKADEFGKYYAEVNRLSFSRAERAQNRTAKKILASPSVDNKETARFTMEELETALGKMKQRGAEGPDDIPPSFLKALGPQAKGELLRIFNASMTAGHCPQGWKCATVLPILARGKPACAIKSYRPISLTSCVVKLM